MKSLKTVCTAGLLIMLALMAAWLLSGTHAVSGDPHVAAGTLHPAASTPVWLWAGGGRLFDVDFAGDYGWLGGWYGTVGHTTDGGVTWAGQYAGSTEAGMYGVAAISADQAWAVGYDGYDSFIFHTGDGGATWSQQASSMYWSFWNGDITFVDASNGWAVGQEFGPGSSSGLILHTSNGGTTWSQQTSGVAWIALHGVSFADTSNGWTVGGWRHDPPHRQIPLHRRPRTPQRQRPRPRRQLHPPAQSRSPRRLRRPARAMTCHGSPWTMEEERAVAESTPSPTR